MKIKNSVPFLFLIIFLSCSERSEELHLLLEICLQKYLLVQRQQANQRKVITCVLAGLYKNAGTMYE